MAANAETTPGTTSDVTAVEVDPSQSVRSDEELLTGSDAEQATAAALAEYPGAAHGGRGGRHAPAAATTTPPTGRRPADLDRPRPRRPPAWAHPCQSPTGTGRPCANQVGTGRPCAKASVGGVRSG